MICQFCNDWFKERIFKRFSEDRKYVFMECPLCHTEIKIENITAERVVFELNEWCKEKGYKLTVEFNELEN